jgi:hypothetical protein
MNEEFPIIEASSVTIAPQESREGAEQKNFDQLVLDSIDEALKHLFNETAAESIYAYMENMCNLKREDTVKKIDVFSTSLERLLGSGALVIENLILKILFSKVRLEFVERENYRFPDYIAKLKKAYESC